VWNRTQVPRAAASEESAIAGVYDAAVVAGLAQDNITGIFRRYVRR
jgi:hypothetical protein